MSHSPARYDSCLMVSNRRPFSRHIIEYAFCDLDPQIHSSRRHELETEINRQRSFMSARKLRKAVNDVFQSNDKAIREYLGRKLWPHKHVTMILLLTLDGLHQEVTKYIENAGSWYTSRDIAKALSDPVTTLQTGDVSHSLNDAVRKNNKINKSIVDFVDGTVLRLKSNRQPGRSTKEWCILREKESQIELERVHEIVFSVPRDTLTVKQLLGREEASPIQNIIDGWAPRMIEVSGGRDNTFEVFVFRKGGISLFAFHIYLGDLTVAAADRPVAELDI
jgi:hypothetical protein